MPRQARQLSEQEELNLVQDFLFERHTFQWLRYRYHIPIGQIRYIIANFILPELLRRGYNVTTQPRNVQSQTSS